jgi:hypothetical protein
MADAVGSRMWNQPNVPALMRLRLRMLSSA